MGAKFDSVIGDRPFCPLMFDIFFEAYNMLKSSRTEGGIPFPAIESYLRMFPYPDEVLFIKVINAIDLEIATIQNKGNDDG